MWRVANGSLLLPVLLALLVMRYGFRALSQIHESHLAALQPVLEHQAALLKEDRERLALPRRDSTAKKPSSRATARGKA